MKLEENNLTYMQQHAKQLKMTKWWVAAWLIDQEVIGVARGAPGSPSPSSN